MPQLHLYVPETVAAQVAAWAEARGMTVSRLLAEIIGREVGHGWPDDFFESVVGGWKGAPLVRPPQFEFEERDEF